MDASLVLIKMRYNRKGKTYEEEYGKEKSIDLNRKNNAVDNLEIVCLNCHALIHNFNPVKNLGEYAVKKEER